MARHRFFILIVLTFILHISGMLADSPPARGNRFDGLRSTEWDWYADDLLCPLWFKASARERLF